MRREASSRVAGQVTVVRFGGIDGARWRCGTGTAVAACAGRGVRLRVVAEGATISPWSVRWPIILDLTAATGIGYQPAGTAIDLIGREVDWLLRREPTSEWRRAAPGSPSERQ